MARRMAGWVLALAAVGGAAGGAELASGTAPATAPAPPSATAPASANAPAPPPAPGPAPAPAEEPGQPLVGFGSPALDAPGGLASAAEVPKRAISVSAWFTVGGRWLQQDPTALAIGRNGGFQMAAARLEVTGRPSERLWLYLSLDGAVARPSAGDPLQGGRGVVLKDAYGIYAPGYHLRLQLGQFKAPQGLEELLEETELKFPTRSIVSEGVHPPAGYEQAGLSLDRQVGIGLGTDAIPLPFGTLAAQLAVTNGNGPNQLFNDTDSPSISLRAALGLFGVASVGGFYYAMPRSLGTQPELFREDWSGYGVDARVRVGPVSAMAQAQWRTTKHVTTGAPDEASSGWSAEVACLLAGFVEPALRFASLDPSDKVPAAQVTELTAALNLYAFGPGTAHLSLAWVHRSEQPSRALQNDGVDLAAHVRF